MNPKNRSTLAAAALLALACTPLVAPADPPPWAPAHGWRKQHDPNYVGYTGKKWNDDYGVVEGHCNTAAVGAVLGGAVGGAIGAKASSPEDRPIAIVLGTAIGAVIGQTIGRELEDADRACMGHALELAGERRSVAWTNATTGVTYRLTPTGAFKDGATPCRRFATVVSTGKKKRKTIHGTACRRNGGEWIFRS